MAKRKRKNWVEPIRITNPNNCQKCNASVVYMDEIKIPNGELVRRCDNCNYYEPLNPNTK